MASSYQRRRTRNVLMVRTSCKINRSQQSINSLVQERQKIAAGMHQAQPSKILEKVQEVYAKKSGTRFHAHHGQDGHHNSNL